jgi:sporulation protein YlmC with PRC-barrel domain
MLPRLNQMRGASVQASDGDIGQVSDFYFDDESWTVRFTVADTGSWLAGRRVLLPLAALDSLDWTGRRLVVNLTREQVRNSPDVDTIRPVSRQVEAEALTYYGYPIYWAAPSPWVPTTMPAPPPPARTPAASDDAHLRSCREVIGYHVRTTDGEQGHVDDLLIDPETWTIEQLLVDTSNWIGGRWVLIPTHAVRGVDWGTRSFELGLTQQAVLDSPEVPAGEHPALRRRTDKRPGL